MIEFDKSLPPVERIWSLMLSNNVFDSFAGVAKKPTPAVGWDNVIACCNPFCGFDFFGSRIAVCPNRSDKSLKQKIGLTWKPWCLLGFFQLSYCGTFLRTFGFFSQTRNGGGYVLDRGNFPCTRQWRSTKRLIPEKPVISGKTKVLGKHLSWKISQNAQKYNGGSNAKSQQIAGLLASCKSGE